MERLAKKLESVPANLALGGESPATDHTYHMGLNLHPEHREAWEALKAAPELRRRSKELIPGCYPKVIYSNPETGQRYLVKAYHDTGYGNLPLGMGHAEMISQSLYHAAGIPQLHQRVWVDEMPVAKTHGKTHPMVVIAMDPHISQHIENLRFVGNDLKYSLDPKEVMGQWAKISLMDALLGQTDRHGQNLLMGHREDGSSALLAIDNGMAQMVPSYMAAKAPIGYYSLAPTAARILHDAFPGVARWNDCLRESGRWFEENAQSIYDEFGHHLPTILDEDQRSDHARHFLDRFDQVNKYARLVQGAQDPLDLSMRIMV
jgi:hypothetical protein